MLSPPPTLDERLATEACRLHERYSVEVIERFNLCPWARKVRLDGTLVRRVLLQDDVDPEPTLALLDGLEGAPETVPMAIAIYPRLAVSPAEFDAFAAGIKARDQQRHGGRPVYVSASFHPAYGFDGRSASSMIPWLRRSPDPSLQLVRLEVIEEARGRSGKIVFDFSPGAWTELRRRLERGTVPDRIAADNRATIDRERAELERAFEEIAADRARSYARLLARPV